MRREALGMIKILLPLAFIFLTGASYAEDREPQKALSKDCCQSGTQEQANLCFNGLKEEYFTTNRYSEFSDYLKTLCPDNELIQPFVSYYIALSRYSQLKYLEEKQLWDEYFAQGNDYRSEITARTQKAIDATKMGEALNLSSRFLLWQFHKGQQDTSSDGALTDLMASAVEYAKGGPKDLKPVKEVADELLRYGEKGKAKELYKIYSQRLADSDIKDEALKDIARGFYQDGNLELAQNIYDIYIERAAKSLSKEEFISQLTDIARDFSYKDNGLKDMAYAEKTFKKIESIGGENIFDEELMHLRALNLEKLKDYLKAKDAYIKFISKFPQSKYLSEAVYKVGIIYTYILRGADEGKGYFEKLTNKGPDNPHVLSSLYQLGLLAQWDGDILKAKEYYNKLVKDSENNLSDTLDMAKARLKEIEENKPIEYNLKTFIDISLKKEYVNLDVSKLELKASTYILDKGKNTDINSQVYLSPSGCLQIELQYLWSGDLGAGQPSLNHSEFKTAYSSTGTKVINLVVIAASGITERSLDFVDVY
ncbi:MAG: tetratricopeptide repeat protein [Candidatus Omnitrophica bacterium]|nr:tetratricopeptide repeat protein [Candidatus Omnitrophota bacterium]